MSLERRLVRLLPRDHRAEFGEDAEEVLAARYRRLVRLFPADHRAVHEDEMVGVLLAGAGDRRTPPAADVADLVLGAVVVRLRGGVPPVWREAFATAGVVLTLLVLTAQVADLAGGVVHAIPASWVLESQIWILPYAVMVVLTLHGGRIVVIAGAWIMAAVAAVVPVLVPMTLNGVPDLASNVTWAAPPTLIAVLLTAGGDVRAVWTRLRPGRVARAACCGLGALLTQSATFDLRPWPSLGLTFVAVLAGVAWAWPVGRRVAVLVAPVALLAFTVRPFHGVVFPHWYFTLAAVGVPVLVFALVARSSVSGVLVER